MKPPMGINPFRFSGPLDPEDMIDREEETGDLLALAEGMHSSRLVGPRRYGKSSLLDKVLDEADKIGMMTVRVDLEEVNTLASIVIRIEQAYNKSLKGTARSAVSDIFRKWNLGLALGGPGFTARIQQNPRLDPEGTLLQILRLPEEVQQKKGLRSLIVFDEFQDVLRVDGADGIIRSVIQHHLDAASYSFAGSAPGMMEQLFSRSSRPLLSQAVPKTLEPLPLDQTAAYLEERFRVQGKEISDTLNSLLAFTRGHPQRTMLLAHYLWQEVKPGQAADIANWERALEKVLAQESPAFQADWQQRAISQQKYAQYLAHPHTGLYDSKSLQLVGLNTASSAQKAKEYLLSQADVIESDGEVKLTDPLFEHWIRENKKINS